jgi:excisionase family DNA binding protein
MNKKEVADALGVSVRLVERYSSEGRLGEVRYVRGKTGKQADYDQDSVEALKRDLETIDYPTNSPAAGVVGALELRRGSQAEQFAEMIARLVTQAPQRPEQTRTTDLAAKLMLNLNEAAQLAGLSRGILRDAISQKKLKARILGRGFKIKKTDLEAWISKL